MNCKDLVMIVDRMFYCILGVLLVVMTQSCVRCNTTNYDLFKKGINVFCSEEDSLQEEGNVVAFDMLSYEKLYKDSFDIYLSDFMTGHNRDKSEAAEIDTMHMEMLLACNLLRSHYNQGRDVTKYKNLGAFINSRIDSIWVLDTRTEAHIKLLELKNAVLFMMGDIEGFKENELQMYNLYPHNSLERLSSLGLHYYTLDQHDSSCYYLNKAYQVACELDDSDDDFVRQVAYYSVIASLSLLMRDSELCEYLEEKMSLEKDVETLEFITEAYANIDSVRAELMQMINSKRDMFKGDY